MTEEWTTEEYITPRNRRWVRKQLMLTEEEREKRRRRHQRLVEQYRRKQEAREKFLKNK